MLEAMKDGVIIVLLFNLCALVGVVIGRLLLKKTPKTVKVKPEEKEKRSAIVFNAIDGKFVLLEVDRIKQIEEIDGEKTLIYYGHNVKTGEPSRTYVVSHPFHEVISAIENSITVKFAYQRSAADLSFSELYWKYRFSSKRKEKEEQGEDDK